MNIDEISMKIIKHLREGRKLFDEIGKNVSTTTNRVRARVRKLHVSARTEVAGDHTNRFGARSEFLF